MPETDKIKLETEGYKPMSILECFDQAVIKLNDFVLLFRYLFIYFIAELSTSLLVYSDIDSYDICLIAWRAWTSSS